MISVMGALRNLSVTMLMFPLFISTFNIRGISRTPPKARPDSATNMLPLSSKVTLLGKLRFHNIGSILKPFEMFKFSGEGACPLFITDDINSGGMVSILSGCWAFAAAMSDGGLRKTAGKTSDADNSRLAIIRCLTGLAVKKYLCPMDFGRTNDLSRSTSNINSKEENLKESFVMKEYIHDQFPRIAIYH
jgi:hypothetical protein